jgi:hypothetical protein
MMEWSEIDQRSPRLSVKAIVLAVMTAIITAALIAYFNCAVC